MSEPQEALTTSPAATAVLVTAGVLLAIIGRKVANNETTAIDANVRAVVQEHRTETLDVVVKPITLLSIPLTVVSATAALVWWLHQNGREDAALAIGLTPIVAAATGQSFTSLFRQHSPPDATEAADGKTPEATFPSGHTTGVTAEALAIAYVLSREKLASPATLAGLLAWPLVVGVSRIYRDRHWLSDIVAGWIAGIGVASLAAVFYRARTAPESSS
ncbi:MAG: phosphatase PAP2 family protein [bacterium]